MAKKYYWLKLKEDFFEEKQIRYLRKLPDGDKLVIAYLKMQLKSLRTEGFIKYDQIMPNNEEELAMILDEDINIIKLMIQALIKVKAIEVLDDGSFYLIAMQDLVGKEGESAERVRRFRERQNQKMLQSNANVTKCNTEIEKEIKKELDIEKEIDVEENSALADIKNKLQEEFVCCIGSTNLNSIMECLSYLDDLPFEVIQIALKKTADVNGKWNYAKTILNKWVKEKIDTVEKVKTEELNFKKGKQPTGETEEEKMARKIKSLEEDFGSGN